MVPDKEWRGEGQNVDKRTARKIHAEEFQHTIREIRQEYLREFQARQVKAEPEIGSDQIHVYVRKRPVLEHEAANHEFDVISSIGLREIVIHECKMHNDMRHKYIMSHHQRFSRCYDEKTETETVYEDAGKPLVLHAMSGGKSVCMMYGQTGSGKTYTMGGMFAFIAEDLFTEAVGDVDFDVSVSAIEIVGSKCFDLLHERSKVMVCDDADGNTSLLNCSETSADSSNSLLDILENVKSLRTTEATNVNSQSSRSHLVVYVNLRDNKGALYGQLVLLDLAGSERNEDSFYHDAARRKETIEINKSHLALKECIRAIGSEDTSGYVPYRASTLTRILKSCLWSKNSRASVIATISPLSVDTEHTLHALLCAGQMLEETPHLRTEKTEVEQDEPPIMAVREWDNEMVREWICGQRKGSFAKYSGNITTALDGRMLVRFTVARFTQICDGDATDAAHLFKALRNEMASQEKQLKAKRVRIAGRNAPKAGVHRD
jgi:kinesin family member 2/24